MAREITDKGLAKNIRKIVWYRRPSTGGHCPGGRLYQKEEGGFGIKGISGKYQLKIGDIITINGKRDYTYRESRRKSVSGIGGLPCLDLPPLNLQVL